MHNEEEDFTPCFNTGISSCGPGDKQTVLFELELSDHFSTLENDTTTCRVNPLIIIIIIIIKTFV